MATDKTSSSSPGASLEVGVEATLQDQKDIQPKLKVEPTTLLDAQISTGKLSSSQEVTHTERSSESSSALHNDPKADRQAKTAKYIKRRAQEAALETNSDDTEDSGHEASDDYISLTRSEREENARRRVHRISTYALLMESRVMELETRVKTLEGTTDKDDSRTRNNKSHSRRKATPKLNWVTWEQMKGSRYETKEDLGYLPTTAHFAIDVLLGEPRLLFDYQRNATGSSDVGKKVNKLDDLQTGATSNPTVELPERVRINSLPLIIILKKLQKIDSTDSPWIMRKPFRMLLFHENTLREIMKSIASRLAPSVKMEDWKRKVANESVGSVDSGTTPSESPEESNETKQSETLYNSGASSETEDDITTSIEAFHDLTCLFEFIDDVLKPAITRIRGLKDVQFLDLCLLFSPEDFIYHKRGKQKIWRIVYSSGGRSFVSLKDRDETNVQYSESKSPLLIYCYYLDFDGASYGPVSKYFSISPYDGYRSLESLDFQPLSTIATAQEEAELWTERGREFLRCLGIGRKRYTGLTETTNASDEKLETTSEETLIAENVDSQIILDFEFAMQQKPIWAPLYDISYTLSQEWAETIEASLGATNKHGEYCDKLFCCGNEWIPTDMIWIAKRSDEVISKDPILKKGSHSTDSNDIPLEQLKILPYQTFGFVLRTRKWASLSLDRKYLTEITEEKNALDSLELPDGHREIIQALVAQHFRERFDGSKPSQGLDVVRGKGKGLIILLHGAPGVGKTSTAECIAEAIGKPLFPITCGDLGVTSNAVESSLSENFQLATRWNCILLLDEADVFLSRRSKTELERNALVSVFLRELEYYSGVLFLTTNRVGDIDEAFKSRIHLSLYYPELSAAQTRKIWMKNLTRVQELKPSLQVNRDKIKDYSVDLYAVQRQHPLATPWNGRQIRNAFQTAVAIAESEAHASDKDPVLKVQHFQQVAKVSADFDVYLSETRHMTDSEQARHELLRHDKQIDSASMPRSAYPRPSYGDPRGQAAPGASPWANAFSNNTGSPWTAPNNLPMNLPFEIGGFNAPQNLAPGQTTPLASRQAPFGQSMQDPQSIYLDPAHPGYQARSYSPSGATNASGQPQQPFAQQAANAQTQPQHQGQTYQQQPGFQQPHTGYNG